MKNYQIVLPLLALAFAMTFVEKTAAFRSPPCPPNQVWSFNICDMKYCSDIARLSETECRQNASGCVCDDGYYWQDTGCVLAKDCGVTCPGIMVFKVCYGKPPICGSQESQPPDPNDKCRPRCVCPSGYIQAEEGSQECILQEECKLP
ncbi:uncharacterized protein ACMZJ9_018742 [Mantella aurantiaca]